MASMAVHTSLRIVTAHSSGVHIRLATVAVLRTAQIAAAHGLSVLTDCDGSTCRSGQLQSTHGRPARTGPLELSAEPMECSAATADSLIEHSARANVQLCQRVLKLCHRVCPHHRESSSCATQFAVFTFSCARVLDRSCSTCASGERARTQRSSFRVSAHATSCTLCEHSTCARSGRGVSCARSHPTGVKLRLCTRHDVCSSCASTSCEFKTSTGARSSWTVGLQRSVIAHHLRQSPTCARTRWDVGCTCELSHHCRHVDLPSKVTAAWRSKSTILVEFASLLCGF
jgi:hypothetical protein